MAIQRFTAGRLNLGTTAPWGPMIRCGGELWFSSVLGLYLPDAGRHPRWRQLKVWTLPNVPPGGKVPPVENFDKYGG